MSFVRIISEENQLALEAGKLVARDFMWITVRNRSNGAQQAFGFWSDIGNVSAEVINPNTGSAVTRTWEGAGSLIEMDDIPLVSNLQVQTIRIKMNQISSMVDTLIRTYDAKQAPIEIYRGMLNPATRQMVAPALNRFIGFVDTIDWDTPEEGSEGGVYLNCVSHTQEMTRSNPDTRSHASQLKRNATDAFYKDTAVVGRLVS